jgi:Type II secretion system (T2SS), protein G
MSRFADPGCSANGSGGDQQVARRTVENGSGRQDSNLLGGARKKLRCGAAFAGVFLVPPRREAQGQAGPWGKDYLLKCPGAQGADSLDVISMGPDKQEGTAEDIKASNN